jgi:2,5-diketo-D-gluconate reductase A
MSAVWTHGVGAGIPRVALNDGNSIPQLGLGTYPLTDDEVPGVIVTAIDAGYRHIDTAAAYKNEAGVGEGIRRSGIARDELFVTTKLDNPKQAGDDPLRAAEESLGRLGLDYVDLYLIHWPIPAEDNYVSAWRQLIRLREEGLVRSIGVSNFRPAHLDRLRAETGVDPAVNQIQVNPVVSHPGVRAYNAEHGIVTESWGPLGSGNELLGDERLAAIAYKHERTVGQIVLRWHLELGLVVIPKSANPERIRQNASVFDFALDAEDMQAVAALDQGFPANYGPLSGGE